MRARIVGGLGVAIAFVVSALAACVDDSATSTPDDAGPAQGVEGGPCFANGTCNDALVCVVPNLCVKPGADSGMADSSSGVDSSADTSVADTSVGDAADAAPPPPSCATSGDGRTNCGLGSESCCTSLPVAGGTYNRTFVSDAGVPTGQADPATVGDFKLDKYEVTVGRFRQFVAAWNGGAGYTPPAGSGKHTHLNGGNGLNATAGGNEPGWSIADNANIAPTAANLACDATFATWTVSPGANEKRPINCETWYELAAFCIWDGGFLPSEAEWELAAVGGSEQRQYPWGPTAPGTANQYAIYNCDFPSSSGTCSNAANIAPVGTPTAGAGKFGQLDLAGNAYEWNLDWFKTPYVSCTNCVNATASTGHLIRGGAFEYPEPNFRPSSRGSQGPTTRVFDLGGRCARTP